ncbi:hypothetical protein BD410DRAFT_808615 [Rickenella mellea]|uniref:F-box domain-containing protein n=1 Tax=Rickenella mellea TaxID=50990 RepID=A0A4Y7PKA0_9AGAM|nr:hypothetical protein BD410DRAFT_808615 [Rickenella mellea]
MASTFSFGAARISCISADVLSLIFIESVPDNIMSDDEYLIFPRPSLHQSPLILGRVCRLWREISLATPRLWCRIQLGDMRSTRDAYYSPLYCRDLERDSLTLQEWLRRSGNCPLSIGICYDECHGSEIDFIQKTMEIAILYIHRWKHFTTHLPTALFSWNVIFPMLEMAKPDLEGLHLIADDAFSEEWDWCPRYFRPLHLIPSMADSTCMIVTGHHNLRTLILTSAVVNLEWFILCVTHCHLLEKIEVIGDNAPSILSTAKPELNETHTLLHLTALDLSSVDDPIGPFLDVITCPVLEYLSVVQDLDPPDDDHITSWPHLGQFLQRSRPPLKRLDLENIPMALKDFRYSFTQVPSLELLSLESMKVPKKLFYILILSPGLDHPLDLLPKLKSLTVRDNSVPTYGDRLTSLVLSRWNCKCMREPTVSIAFVSRGGSGTYDACWTIEVFA